MPNPPNNSNSTPSTGSLRCLRYRLLQCLRSLPHQCLRSRSLHCMQNPQLERVPYRQAHVAPYPRLCGALGMENSRPLSLLFVLSLVLTLGQGCPSSPPGTVDVGLGTDAVADHDPGMDSVSTDAPIDTLLPDLQVEDLAPGDGAGLDALDLGADEVAGPEELLDQFFSLSSVHSLEIELDDAAVQALIAEPRVYQKGQLTIDGTLYPDVGIRLKGSFGSFVALDETTADGRMPGKSAFVIDFNRYVQGQDLFGLKKLTVNNMVQDGSGIHQYVGYSFFREAGIPASRSGFGQVSLNGTSKGLYALIEAPDNKLFTKRWFGSDNGNLYEGAGADFTKDAYVNFDQERGEDSSKEDLRLLAEALDAAPVGDGAYEVLASNLDLDQYLLFVATEIFLSHWDGYAWNTNNYMIYHNLDDGRFAFIPWGADQLFDENGILGPYHGVMKSPGPSWAKPERGFDALCNGGRIQHICYSSPKCMAELAKKHREVYQLAKTMGLASVAADSRALVEPWVLQEAEQYGDPVATKAALDQVEEFIATRAQQLELWLPCLEGQSVDLDNDGVDGCTLDCTDTDPAIFPGASEVCNLKDDDCTGILDDAADCEECTDVKLASGTYSLCFHPTTWVQARQNCVDRGQELASIHDSDTNMMLIWSLLQQTGYIEGWIGLNDITAEQVYEWSDGAPIDFDYRIFDMPAEWAVWLDCYASNILLGWWPAVCWEDRAYICKTP